MDSVQPTNARPQVVVDPAARALSDVSGNPIGMAGLLPRGERLAWATALSSPVAVSLRYQPSHPPGEACNFGLDFSALVAPGLWITTGSLQILTNVANPAVSADWTIGPVTIRGRAVYSLMSGGVSGTDYQLKWSATDALGNVWVRTVLCLCAATS